MNVNAIYIHNKFNYSNVIPIVFNAANLGQTSNFTLRGLDGFGPSAVNPFTEGFDHLGVPIIDMIPEKKELTFKLGYDTSVLTPASVRDIAYQFMSQPVRVELRDMNAMQPILAFIEGSIRIADPEHSTNDPTITLQIMCDDGFFKSASGALFPNPAPADKSQLLLGPCIGSAPAGFALQVLFTANATTFGMYGVVNNSVVGNWHWDVEYAFQTGDTLIIYTDRENRALIHQRGPTITDITAFLSAGSVWPKMYPDRQTLIHMTNLNWQHNGVASVSYTPRYWGF